MKIFQIGFNKCGTASLYEVFKNHTSTKLNAIHWDDGRLGQTIYENYLNDNPILKGYENFDYYGDMQHKIYKDNKPYAMILPYISMFILLDQQYSGSKFILNTRDINNWLRSRINWLPGRDNDFYMRAYGIKNQKSLMALYTKLWHQHHNIVKDYFYNRPKDLLIFDIEKDNVQKLKIFFYEYDINITIDKMPRLNRSIYA